MSKLFAIILFGLALASFSFATTPCAYSSYHKACQYCSFDQNGKMDQSCYQGYQGGGTSCVASTYPIASGKYSLGQCPQIDSCTSDLQRCKAMVTSGNDKTDCSQSYVADCFSQADACMEAAAEACGDKIKVCPFALLLPALLGFVFLRRLS